MLLDCSPPSAYVARSECSSRVAAGRDLCSDDIRRRRMWANIRRKIELMRQLADDWDGADAVAPTPSVIDYAIKWTYAFENAASGSPYHAMALPDGRISMVWESPRKILEVEDEGRLSATLITFQPGGTVAEAVREPMESI